jgi:outer membrane receptor for ferrienterochelin and colicins
MAAPLLLRIQLPFLVLAACCVVSPAPAQQPGGTLTVRVASEGRPLRDAQVRAARRLALTDDSGTARLRLAAGRWVVVVAKLGFRPDTLSVVVTEGRETTLAADLAEAPAELEAIIVSTTRAERRLEDEPARVEVLAGGEVAEMAEIRPGDVSQMVSEMSGVRVQSTAPGLGGAAVRIQGLRGQYTQILSDGLPLLGVPSGGLSLLETPPLDLRQVEIVKGATTALYGPSALGGVVNLLSRRPDDGRELVLNATSRGGLDASAWVSRQISERWGYALIAGAHRQGRVDVNGDGWADIARFRRGEVRPRLYWTGGDGSTFLATAGAMEEDRGGGTMPGRLAPDGNPFEISVATQRLDAGFTGRFLFGRPLVLGVRAAASGLFQRHRYGDVFERDRHGTFLAEVTVGGGKNPFEWLVGAAVQRETYHNTDLPAFDYGFTTPAVFAQATVMPLAALVATVSGRCDAHSRYGTFCSPRVSALWRVTPSVSTRLSVGGGFYAPTPFTEETEAAGLGRLHPPSPDLRAERVRSAALDVTFQRGPVELTATGFASDLDHAVGVYGPPSPPVVYAGPTFVNVAGPTRTRGVEILGVLEKEPISLTSYYAYVFATEVDATSGLRRDVPLTPRHAAGFDLAFEQEETGTRVAVEAFYVGRQALERDPYAAVSRPFTTIGVLVAHRFGRATLFLNCENAGGIRQTSFAPLLLPHQDFLGRWTTDAWAPLDGRVVNGGVRFPL